MDVKSVQFRCMFLAYIDLREESFKFSSQSCFKRTNEHVFIKNSNLIKKNLCKTTYKDTVTSQLGVWYFYAFVYLLVYTVDVSEE